MKDKIINIIEERKKELRKNKDKFLNRLDTVYATEDDKISYLEIHYALIELDDLIDKIRMVK